MTVRLQNMIHQEIERALRGVTIEIDGLCTAYDPTNHLAKVALQPEGQETGWLQIEVLHAGNGFGILVGLTPGDGKSTGDQVKVRFSYGDLESGKVSLRSHSDVDKPPPVQSGEVLMMHSSGSKHYFDQSGNVTHVANQLYSVTGQNGVTITAQGTPGGNLE